MTPCVDGGFDVDFLRPARMLPDDDLDDDRYLFAAGLLTQSAGRPPAVAEADAPPISISLSYADGGRRSERKAVLWIVLLAATLLLAALA